MSNIIELSPREGVRLLFVEVEKESTDFIVMGFPGSVELTKGIERYDLYANGINNTPYRNLYQKMKPVVLGIATQLGEEVVRELVEEGKPYGSRSFYKLYNQKKAETTDPMNSWASFLRLHGIGENWLVLRVGNK